MIILSKYIVRLLINTILNVQDLWKKSDAKDYITSLFGITDDDLLMLAEKKSDYINSTLQYTDWR